MHHALAELSERFSATVDHIGTLLSPSRNGSAETPAEAPTGAEAPETLAELASEPPAGEAEVAASTEEAASADSDVEAPGEPLEVPTNLKRFQWRHPRATRRQRQSKLIWH